MKLTELEPQFLQYKCEPVDPNSYIDGIRSPSGVRISFPRVETLAEAHGICFLCPLCFQRNGGEVGTHNVICWFEDRVPETAEPEPGRWNPVGTGYADLFFIPGKKSHSVQLTGGCNWHGHVINGEVTIL